MESSVFNRSRRRRKDHSKVDITLVVIGHGLLSKELEEHLRLWDWGDTLGEFLKHYSGLIGVSHNLHTRLHLQGLKNPRYSDTAHQRI